MCENFTELDYADLKISVTVGFAKMYNMSISDTVDLFQSNGFYELIDRGREIFITHLCGYTVHFIARELGLPLKTEPFVG